MSKLKGIEEKILEHVEYQKEAIAQEEFKLKRREDAPIYPSGAKLSVTQDLGIGDKIGQVIYLKSNYGHKEVILKRVDDYGIVIAGTVSNTFIPWHLVTEITFGV